MTGQPFTVMSHSPQLLLNALSRVKKDGPPVIIVANLGAPPSLPPGFAPLVFTDLSDLRFMIFYA
jgi:hypothetical protein